MNPALDKASLRRRLLAARRQMANREILQRRLDEALHESGCPWWTGSHPTEQFPRIAAYEALPYEASLLRVLETLASQGVEVAFPRVEAGRELSFAVVPRSSLVPGSMGLREPPQDAPRVPPSSIELFFVPGVAFTESGLRLGYGQGFYDRALAEARPKLTVGVGFEVQVVASLPVEPHDVRLDALVTEGGFRWTTP